MPFWPDQAHIFLGLTVAFALAFMGIICCLTIILIPIGILLFILAAAFLNDRINVHCKRAQIRKNKMLFPQLIWS